MPVLSWLMLRGRCRNCDERISPRYPLAELAMAVSFTATVVVLGTGDLAELALGLIFCALLVTVTLTDLDRRVIPNAILAAGAAAAIVIVAVTDPSSLPERAIAAAGAGGFLLLAALAYPRGMGMGDVKLAAVMGLYLGEAVIPAMFVAPRRRRPGRRRADGAARLRRPQDGGALRPLPRPGRDRGAAGGPRDPRLVPRLLRPLMAPVSLEFQPTKVGMASAGADTDGVIGRGKA